MRNDNEIVYRQNMTRNEAVHILKAIAFPIAVFCLGLFTINMFGEFGKKLICPLSGAMWDVGVLVALLMPSQRKDALNHMLIVCATYYGTLITVHAVLSVVSGVSSEMIAASFEQAIPTSTGNAIPGYLQTMMWFTGNQVIITVSAYVKTMSPFLSGERSIVHMVTIEDSDELVGNGNAEKIWNYLLSHGITPAGAAGILGNMANESSTNLDSTLLEERAVRRTRITGQMYTQMVDSGEISRAEVISSSRFGLYSGGRYGYGIVQFTDPTIKEYLCRYTIDKGKSIGDLKGQLDSLMAYLQQYEPALLNTLKSIQDVEAASTAFLTQYEKPANIEREKGERASAAQLYYQQLLSN